MSVHIVQMIPKLDVGCEFEYGIGLSCIQHYCHLNAGIASHFQGFWKSGVSSHSWCSTFEIHLSTQKLLRLLLMAICIFLTKFILIFFFFIVKSKKVFIFRHFLSKLPQLQLSIIKEKSKEKNKQSVIN